MEQLTIYFGQKPSFGGKWLRLSQIVLGIIFIVEGLVTTGKLSWFRPFLIGYGVCLVVVFLLGPRFSRVCAITLDDRGIRGRLSYSNEIDLLWENVASAEMKMFALILVTKDGHSIPVDFSEWAAEQHKSVKPKLIALLRSKNLLKETP